MKAIIAGAGIGGLTTALCLHKTGWDVEIYETVPEIKPLGVGINLLPHGASVIHELGLGDELNDTGIQTRAIEYRTKFGHLITSDPRGVAASYEYPQYSIHRGELQFILLNAVKARIGANKIRTNCCFKSFTQGENSVVGKFVNPNNMATELLVSGDILLGADGINSKVRKQLHPNEGPPHYEGVMMWRGCNEQAPFGDGRTMFIAGNHDVKLVCYPISEMSRRNGCSLINWVAEVRNSSPGVMADADWNRPATRDFLEAFRGFQMEDIDVISLFENTVLINEYPMIDRDPLPWWSSGRVSLLGDAAHPMYPIGANGASQAIIDGKALADALSFATDPASGLQVYENERRLRTADVVLSNRQSGPEKVLYIADKRVTGPNDIIEDLITKDEIEAVVRKYRAVAGFQKITEKPLAPDES
jgi:2-polyprenyl-6-methoxyphenol hydroxylase-like FAD-dependent oxidoreductase